MEDVTILSFINIISQNPNISLNIKEENKEYVVIEYEGLEYKVLLDKPIGPV